MGPELLQPWPGRTWGWSHRSGLQEWLQSLQLRWHNPCCTLTAGSGTRLPPLGNMVPGHLPPMVPLSKDIPRGHLHLSTLPV